MIDADVPGDAEQPGGKSGEVASIAGAGRPGFFERAGGQVLGLGRTTQPEPEIVVDAWQLVRVHRVPVHFVRRLPGAGACHVRLLQDHESYIRRDPGSITPSVRKSGVELDLPWMIPST